MSEAIPCTTAFEIPGRELGEHLGLVWGVLARSMGFAKGLTGSIKALRAGEVDQYTDVLDQARRQALQRMIEHAQQLGADAIIGVRFASSDIDGSSGSGLAEILAYGSAVRLK